MEYKPKAEYRIDLRGKEIKLLERLVQREMRTINIPTEEFKQYEDILMNLLKREYLGYTIQIGGKLN